VSARVVDALVEIAVEDRGPGFAAADLPRVFEPFFTTKAAGEGTGLGLAICRGIVEALGGEISAENAKAGGARVTLRLRSALGPCAAPDGPDPERAGARARVPR
jgi:two-component system, NtrC family, sensor kinase